jgi:hypothetical protein
MRPIWSPWMQRFAETREKMFSSLFLQKFGSDILLEKNLLQKDLLLQSRDFDKWVDKMGQFNFPKLLVCILKRPGGEGYESCGNHSL